MKPRLTLPGLILCLLASTGLWEAILPVQGQSSASASPLYSAGELVVGLEERADPADLTLPEGASWAATPAALSDSLNTYNLVVPAGREAEFRSVLLQSALVAYVDFNFRLQAADTLPDDPLFYPGATPPSSPEGQYGLNMIHAPAAWDFTTGSSSVVVAVVDTGIDRGHPEFSGRVLTGYDFIQNDTNPQDPAGHGTHIAGIIAAEGNNTQGVAGLGWAIHILPVRVLDSSGGGELSTVAAGILWAVEQGAQIINLSLGTSSASSLLEDATWYAYSHGAVVIASAGNNGSTPLPYPARYPWVLSVTAVNSSSFRVPSSNYGPELDLAAPGWQVLSTTPREAFTYETLYGATREYGMLTGTSVAAAHASGAAALMLSYAPERFDHPLRIFQALQDTALDLGDPGRDDDFGHGLLQLDAALVFIPTIEPHEPVQPDLRYEYIRSSQCQNLQFNWLDATPGTLLDFPAPTQTAEISLPFDFAFAGFSYDMANINLNGFLTFDAVALAHPGINSILPGIASPNNLLAPLWDDLALLTHPGAGIYTRTFGSTPNRQLVIEWHDFALQSDLGAHLTFEMILYETSGEIRYQYLALESSPNPTASASIGLEYQDGEAGLQVAYLESDAVSDREALAFYPGSFPDAASLPNCVYSDWSDPSGGNLVLDPFCLEIPAATLSGQTLFRMERLQQVSPLPNDLVDLGAYVDITSNPTLHPPFVPGIRVCYYYSAHDLSQAGGHTDNLFFYILENGIWQILPTTLEQTQGRIWAYTPHFSIFGVFADRPLALPVTGNSTPMHTGSTVTPSTTNIEEDSGQITFIRIPELNLLAPVTPAGWHTNWAGSGEPVWDDPHASVGWVVSSSLPGEDGNIILYGHNNLDSSVFRDLYTLHPGAEITLNTTVGEWHYMVSDVVIEAVNSINSAENLKTWLRQSSAPRLTIISCWPPESNSHRVILTAYPVLLP